MGLKVPLQQSQVDAANRLHVRLVRWQRGDRALERLNSSCKDFSQESTLLKAAAVNSLYGTNVYPEHGMFMGNRGRLHDDNRQIVRQRCSVKRWIICLTSFKDRKRSQMLINGPDLEKATQMRFRIRI